MYGQASAINKLLIVNGEAYPGRIKDLRSRFRCIAPDLPGFGLSPAAPGYAHTLTSDSLLVERFIQALGLRDEEIEP